MVAGDSALNTLFFPIWTILDNFVQFWTTFRKKTPEHPVKNRSFRTKRVKFPRKNRLLIKFSKIHQKSPNLPTGSSTYIDDNKQCKSYRANLDVIFQ